MKKTLNLTPKNIVSTILKVVGSKPMFEGVYLKNMENTEEWKDIPKLKGLYQISNLGRIKNVIKNSIKNPIKANKTNNCFENLEWCTRSENMIHAYSKGLLKKTVEGNNKLSEKYGTKTINTNTNEIYTSIVVADLKNGLFKGCLLRDFKRKNRKYGHLIKLDK